MYLFTTSSRKHAILILFLLISLLRAACGGNSNGSGSTTQSPIKIGMLARLTGPEGFIGQAGLKGVQVAADYINANGGILGRQIKLISADTGGDAVDAVPALRKLINIDQVELILGPTSIEAHPVLPLLQQSKIPDIIFGRTTHLDTLLRQYI